jgi:transposase
VNLDRQLPLLDLPPPVTTHHKPKSTRRVFVCPDPNDIFLGAVSLKEHLRSAGLKAPFVIRDLLLEQDWSEFELQYQSLGRAPYAPMAMMGLILYGVRQGIHSLRRLELMARVDLGCMWVSGGIAPDHSVIGQFIDRHSSLISGRLFEDLTMSVLKRTGDSDHTLAGDGTVIEAACSHYGLLHQEAIKARHQAARDEADRNPDDAGSQTRLTQAEQGAALMQGRVEKKKTQGKDTSGLRISGSEPEAMVQRQKRGRGSAPSYKPSVLTNEQRVVVAQAVDPSSETAVIPAMLDQSESIIGKAIKEVLLDGGYCCDAVIDETLKRDIGLLCPEGKIAGEGKQSDKYYTKGCFRYDESSDHYRCPAGELLTVVSRYRGNDKTPGYIQYGTSACMTCTLKSRCTRSATGRKIKRYAGDARKEALRQVMGQPGAKQQYSKRQSWVEPVFSVLRGCQGLNRFRRRGLTGVKTEFALHILAYNLGRAVAFSAHSLLFWFKRPINGLITHFLVIGTHWCEAIQFDERRYTNSPG